MIQFQDFEPRIIPETGILQPTQYENLDETLQDLNSWIEENEIQVLNIETVVLPNIHKFDEEGTVDVAVKVSTKSYSIWYQFFRVWYYV